jgi:hypothetical protein
MLQVCWSPKGGSGTSVVAASLAAQSAAAGRETLLVDLAGDQAAIFGVDVGDGVGDWFGAPDSVGPGALRALEVDVGDRLRLLGQGHANDADWDRDRLALALALFEAGPDHVVIDAGRGIVCELPSRAAEIVVIRACYLALRRLVGIEAGSTSIVLVEEPGRALTRCDVESALGAVDVVLSWDPAVARAVDAGLLMARLPRSLRPLRRLVAPSSRSQA